MAQGLGHKAHEKTLCFLSNFEPYALRPVPLIKASFFGKSTIPFLGHLPGAPFRQRFDRANGNKIKEPGVFIKSC